MKWTFELALFVWFGFFLCSGPAFAEEAQFQHDKVTKQKLEQKLHPREDEDGRIVSMRVLYEASNHLEMEVKYRYSYQDNEPGWIHPVLLNQNGTSHSASSGTSPGPVVKDKNTTWVRLYFKTPRFGTPRPTGVNEILLTMVSSNDTRLDQKRFKWVSSYRPTSGDKPRLLRAVVGTGVSPGLPEERRPVNWGSNPTFYITDGQKKKVCLFLTFENAHGNRLIEVTAKRNGRFDSIQRSRMKRPFPDRSYTLYDDTQRTYLCTRRHAGDWKEFIRLDRTSLGTVSYTVKRSRDSSRGSCSIVGRAMGPRADKARLFTVYLYGPNQTRQLKDRTRFSSRGSFSFHNLPTGRYRIVFDSKVDIPSLRIRPRRVNVSCRAREEDRTTKRVRIRFE